MLSFDINRITYDTIVAQQQLAEQLYNIQSQAQPQQQEQVPPAGGQNAQV